MADKADGWYSSCGTVAGYPFFGNVIMSDCVHVGHSPNFQTLLHIIVSASIMASLPAFINSNWMLSIPAAFPL